MKTNKDLCPTLTANRLRNVRLRLKLNQRDFAKNIGYSTSSICQWESGLKSPGISACHEIIAYAKTKGIKLIIDFLRPD